MANTVTVGTSTIDNSDVSKPNVTADSTIINIDPAQLTTFVEIQVGGVKIAIIRTKGR